MATYFEPIIAVSGTYIEDAASVAAHKYGLGILGLRDDGLTSDVVSAEGDWVFPRFSRQGAMHMSGIVYVPQGLSITSIAAGDNNIGNVDVVTLPSIPTGTNSIGDIRSITTSVTPGTATANLGKAAGGSAGATDVGVALLAARRDTLSVLTPANGQYTWLSTNALGQLHISGHVGIVGSIPAGTEYTEGTGFGGNAIGTAVLARMDQVLSNQVGAGYVDDDPITLRTGISGSLWVLDEYLSKSVHPVGARYPGYPSVYNERVMFIGGPDTSAGSTQQVHVLNNRLMVNVDGTVTTTTNLENALTSLAAAGGGSNTDTLGIDLQRILGTSVAATTIGSSLGLAVGGGISHDQPAASTEPLLIGGHASATSPTAVSTDNDAVRAWFLRNGAQVVSIGTSTGVVPADTTTGLRVSLNPSDTTNGAKVYLNSTGDAILSDTIDNPTTSSVAAMGMVWGAVGGTKWSRVLQANQTTLGTDGTGIPAAGLVGRALNGGASIYDDGEYGPVRITRDGKILISGVVSIIDTVGNQIPATAADGLLVNLGTNNDVTVTGSVTANAGTNLNTSTLVTTTNFTTVFGSSSVIDATQADNTASGPALMSSALNFVYDGSNWDMLRGNSTDGAWISGPVAHDSPDAGRPIKLGLKAVSHKADPTPVANNDVTDWYANRSGVPFVIGGHPNVETSGIYITDAKTNYALLAFPTNVKTMVTEIEALCDNANTVDVGVTVGFHASTTPTGRGMLLTHPGIAAGSGLVRGTGSGILGTGASTDKLLVTSEVPTTGSLRILFSYYTITEA